MVLRSLGWDPIALSLAHSCVLVGVSLTPTSLIGRSGGGGNAIMGGERGEMYPLSPCSAQLL